MSLLNPDPMEKIDDAALGEEFTKGTSHVVLAGLIAAVLVIAVVVVTLLASRKPPVAAGEVVEVWAFPQHGETSGLDAKAKPWPTEPFDQVLLFAHIRLRNQSKLPLQLQNILANTRQADGIPSLSPAAVWRSITSSSGLSAADLAARRQRSLRHAP